LVEYTTWHWIFLINIPIGIIGIVFCFKAMPNITEASVKGFDLGGFVLLAIAMIGLALGIEHIANPDSSKLLSTSLLLAGLIAMLWYAYHAHTHQNALFHSALFKNKLYAIGVAGNFFARLSSNAIPFLMPLLLQIAFHMEPFMTGLMMTPIVLGALLSKPIIRPMIEKVGYRQFLVVNTLLLGACIASFALTSADTPDTLRALHFFIFGTLNSLQFVAMNTLTLKDLAQQDASSGNSFLSMVMMLSMSIGVALSGTLLNLFTGYLGASQLTLAFDWSFISLGILNIIAALIFWQIPKESAHD